MTWRLPALALLGWLLTGCGISSTEPFAYGEPLSGGADGVQLYFVLDRRPYPVLRPGTAESHLQDRLDLLAAGPADAERSAGLTTSLPPGTRLSYEDADPVSARIGVRVDGATLQDLDDRATTQIACTVAVAPLPPAPSGTSGGTRSPGIALKAAGEEEVVDVDCPA